MQEIYEKAKNSLLLYDISFNEFDNMFNNLSAGYACYQKGDIVFYTGEKINSIGLVLTGKVSIIKEDAGGNISIVAEIYPSNLFAEVFVCAGDQNIPVTVQAADSCEVLFIDFAKIIKSDSNAAPKIKLITNMMKILAGKNIVLNQKIDILSKRTIREKLMLYFDLQQNGGKSFTIALNREKLANYLCVDRSAMSNELCKMRDEGLIKFNKNKFELFY